MRQSLPRLPEGVEGSNTDPMASPGTLAITLEAGDSCEKQIVVV
jgi:hypothetical protein